MIPCIETLFVFNGREVPTGNVTSASLDSWVQEFDREVDRIASGLGAKAMHDDITSVKRVGMINIWRSMSIVDNASATVLARVVAYGDQNILDVLSVTFSVGDEDCGYTEFSDGRTLVQSDRHAALFDVKGLRIGTWGRNTIKFDTVFLLDRAYRDRHPIPTRIASDFKDWCSRAAKSLLYQSLSNPFDLKKVCGVSSPGI